MTPSSITSPHVTISGAGPAGLLTAIHLSNLGIPTTLFERSPAPDPWSSKSYTIVLGEKGKSSLQAADPQCLDAVANAGVGRKFIHLFDGGTGEMKSMPKKVPGLGITRPLLVESLEGIARKKGNIEFKLGVGVETVERIVNGEERNTHDDDHLLIHLEDGTTHKTNHLIGADGKWSRVRLSFPELHFQSRMITCPSFGIHLDCPSLPPGWNSDGTYVIQPIHKEECQFYILASPRPKEEGLSISMVANDETVAKFPWLAPPEDMKEGDYGKGGWEDEYSALPMGTHSDSSTLAENLEKLFREEVPAFYELLESQKEAVFGSARINRRVSWLKSIPGENDENTYTTSDGRVTLIGDAAHAMTPSMGEGCNTAMESGVTLVQCVVEVMKERGEVGEECSEESLREAFLRYGVRRPREVVGVQEMSAERNMIKNKQ
ncbi:hypothetical protein ACHAXS_010279 [Conticribra weissflogii]